MGDPTMHQTVNCDMGESYGPWPMGQDEQLMPFIDWANIACGQHASDPDTMQATIALALQHGVAIGAHPGYPDRVGFGRRPFPLHGESLKASLWHQMGALAGQCQAAGTVLNHVKPHGALYNKMMQDDQTLIDVITAVAAFDASLPLVVQAGSRKENLVRQNIAAQHGVSLIFEAFADRAYRQDGQLVPRTQRHAVHENPSDIVKQASTLLQHNYVVSEDGTRFQLDCDTLCFHGDNPACVEALRRLRQV